MKHRLSRFLENFSRIANPRYLMLALLCAACQAADVTVVKSATPPSVSPGGTISNTITVTNTSNPPKNLTNVVISDPLDPNGNTNTTGTVQVSPVAADDTFAGTGNVSLSVPVASGVLANDYMGAGPAATITAFDTASASGGVVTMTTAGANAGAFTYAPPRGYTGADTFHYTLTNTAGTNTATVTINVSNVIWFIDNNAATNGDGRLSAPYNSVANFNTVQGTGGVNPKAGDVIYLYRNTPTAYAGGFTLLNNQRIVGQGVALDATSLSFTPAQFCVGLPAAGTNPQLSNATGNGVTLASGNALFGLDIGNCAGNIDITGSNFGTLTVGSVGIFGTGRPLNLSTGTLAATFTGITTTAATGGQGISLLSVGGSMTVTGGTSITNATTQGILVSGSMANINFGNTTVNGGTNLVSLQSNSAGTRTFGTLNLSNASGSGNAAFLHGAGGGLTVAGNTTISSLPANGPGIDIQNSTTLVTFGDTSVTKITAGVGVNMASNSGGVTFNSLAISTSAGTCLNATENSGTITVTNPTGTIGAQGGAALSITKTTTSTPLAMSLGATNSFNSPVQAMNLQRISGTLTTASGNMGNASGVTFSVSNSSANITHAANMTQNNVQRIVDVQNCTAGTIALSGLVTSTGGAGTGVFLDNNTGATINFTNVVNMITSGNTSFTATNGGTVSVTNTTSSLTTTTATALNLANVTIGAGGMVFKSINTSGASNPIVLNSITGGAISVNGDNSGFANGSGGTLNNASALAISTTGAGGTLNLKSMNINLTAAATGGMYVDNTTGGTYVVNVTGCAFAGVTASAAQNKALLQFSSAGSANVTANVQNCYFNGSKTYGFEADAAGTSVMNVTVNQCGFGTDVNMTAAVNQPGTTITNAPAIGMLIRNTASGQIDYTVSNSTFWGASGALGATYAVSASGGTTTASSHNNGTWNSNKIGKTGTVGSGASGSAGGMGFLPGSQGTFKATITNNDIRQVNNSAIDIVNTTNGNTNLNGSFKVKGNVIAEPDTTGSPASQRAINLQPGNNGATNNPWGAEIGDTTGTVAANKNNISGSWQASSFIRVINTNNSAMLTLPGLTPASGATATQVNTFMTGCNTISASSVSTTVGTGIVGGAPLPLMVAPVERTIQFVHPSPKVSVERTLQLVHPPSVVPKTVLPTSAPQASTQPRHAVLQDGFVTRALTRDQLKPIVAAALQRWSDSGLTTEQARLLQSVDFEIQSMREGYVGMATTGTITLSANGAGLGWYVDLNPLDDKEFDTPSGPTRFYTDSNRLPAGHLDLLTSVMHELGHQLGLRDTHKLADRDNLMYASLTMGERRLPARGQATGVTPNLARGEVAYLFTPITIPNLPAGKSVLIKFDVVVSNPLTPAATTSVTNTASVAGPNITGSPISSNTVTTPINLAPTAFTASGPVPAGDVGAVYPGYTFIANGGPAPTYALSPTSQPLPAGLSLSSAGVLSGANPTAAGTFTGIIIRATNPGGMVDSPAVSITINPALTVLPASLNAATATGSTTRTMTFSNGTKPYASVIISNFIAGTTGLTSNQITTNPSAGTATLNGTPSAAGTLTFTATVTDAIGATLVKNYSLTVNPALAIAPSSLSAATAQAVKNQTITVTGGTTPYTTFSVTGFTAGGTGLTMAALTTNSGAGTVTLDATPTSAGTASFTVNVTDTAGATLTKNYNLTVNPALNIAPAALNAVLPNTSTNQTLTVTGGTTPYTTFAVNNFAAGGTGLTAAAVTSSQVAGTVTVSGTPTSVGAMTFTVDVTDTAGATLSKNYTLNVSLITITPGALPPATAGTAANRTITVNNGQLPLLAISASNLTAGGTGITAAMFSQNLAAGTLTLNGTPTAAGTANFTVNVTDGANTILSQPCSILVNPVPSIGPASLAAATAGAVTNQTITVSNGTTPYTALTISNFNANATGLTAGALTTNPGAGTVTLNGTPTAAGSATFRVNVTDTAGATQQRNYTLTVNAAMTVAPAALTATTAGRATNQVLTVSNGTKPYTVLTTSGFNAGGTGLTAGALSTNLNAGTVTLNGTPSAAGTAQFTVNCTDTPGATLTQNYSLTVNPAITVTPASLPNGAAFTAYSQSVSTTGGTGTKTFAVSAGNLPTGLSLDTATGAISGTPSASGPFNFTITATDTVGATGQRPYSVTISAPVVVVAPITLTAGNVGVAYNAQFTASGALSPYVFSINSGTLPPGISLNGGGVLSGTPTGTGTFNFVVKGADASLAPGPYSGTQAVSLTIGPPTIVVAQTPLPNADVGVAYNQTITASGGTAPYTFAITAGALPNGMTLSSAGVISGAATAEGLAAFTVTATDSSTGTGPFSASAQFTIQVNIATISLQSGPSALPNPAGVGQTITFTAIATGGAGALTYTWNFADGSPAVTGSSVTHPYSAAGSYNVSVTVTDTIAQNASGTLQVTVSNPLVGAGNDIDGDGYSDDFETTVGTSSGSAASTPTGSPATAGSIQALLITKAGIKLGFSKPGNDSISIAGTLNVPAGFNPENAKVIFDISGITKVFTLSAKGSAKTATDSLKISIKAKKGVVAAQTSKYSAAFKKGSFTTQLATAGLTDVEAKSAQKTVTFTCIFNNSILQKAQSMLYTAKPGKSGSAK